MDVGRVQRILILWRQPGSGHADRIGNHLAARGWREESGPVSGRRFWREITRRRADRQAQQRDYPRPEARRAPRLMVSRVGRGEWPKAGEHRRRRFQALRRRRLRERQRKQRWLRVSRSLGRGIRLGIEFRLAEGRIDATFIRARRDLRLGDRCTLTDRLPLRKFQLVVNRGLRRALRSLRRRFADGSKRVCRNAETPTDGLDDGRVFWRTRHRVVRRRLRGRFTGCGRWLDFKRRRLRNGKFARAGRI